MKTAYFMGIDGGGTKTSGVLADANGTVLAAREAGASAIVGAPSAAACTVLRSVFFGLCEDAGLRPSAIARIGLGLNGIDFPDEFAMQHAALAEALDVTPERLGLVNDGIVALWGATPAEAAVVVQHGTGFTSAWRSAHGNECLFDHYDAGRCYDLRAESLALVARMIDGRAVATPLKEAVLAALGYPPEDRYSELVFRNAWPTAERMGVLRAVLATAESGDPAALELVARAADDYVCTACAMAGKVGRGEVVVVFGGGRLVSAPRWFRQRLSAGVRRQCPHAIVKHPELSPALGAAIMAAFAEGLQPGRFFEKGSSDGTD